MFLLDADHSALALELLGGAVAGVKGVSHGLCHGLPGECFADQLPLSRARVFANEARVRSSVVDVIDNTAQDVSLLGLAGCILVLGSQALDKGAELDVAWKHVHLSSSADDDVLFAGNKVLWESDWGGGEHVVVGELSCFAWLLCRCALAKIVRRDGEQQNEKVEVRGVHPRCPFR